MTDPMDADFNPSATSAVIEVLPAGDYEVKVQSLKPFLAKNEDDSTKNYGFRATLVVANGSKEGKKLIANFYLHNDGSREATKRFHMAAVGFSPNPRTPQEDKYNVAFTGKDFKINYTDLVMGEAWREAVGKTLLVTLNEKLYQGNIQQEYKAWEVLK